MLRITPSVSSQGAAKYFDEALARRDYYAEKERSIGLWGGKAAERLDLAGQVNREDFLALASNLDPRTGERLTARTKTVIHSKDGDRQRCAGYDFTFSVPKSVSLYLALNPGDEGELVRGLIQTAFRETMDDMEREMSTRVRRGGQNSERQTGNLVYTAFTHETARPVDGVADPHYHIHAYVFNATFDQEEDRWKAGYFRDLKGDAPYFEACFHARVAEKLLEAGIGIRRTSRDFELASVERQTIEKFSRRTTEVQETARQLKSDLEERARYRQRSEGIDFSEALSKEKAELGSRTRASKDKGVQADNERLAYWRRALSPEERLALSPARARAIGSKDLLSGSEARDLAISHCFERLSLLGYRRLLAQALRFGIGRLKVDEADGFVRGAGELIFVQNKKITSKEVAREERSVLELVRRGSGTKEVLDPEQVWEPGNKRLNDQQREAVRLILGTSDQWVAVRGAAGTGKTTMMQEAVAAVERFAERPVMVLGLSSASIGVLRDEGFSDAETVDMFLRDSRLQDECRGKILWIDEAGFLSSRQMSKVADFAAANGNRVILSGDPYQHHAVERGDMMRVLLKSGVIRWSQLTAIQRQRDPDLRDAVSDLSAGRIAEGFERLDRAGAIVEIEDEHERDTAVVVAHRAAARDGKTILVVSPTHADGERITGRLREVLREEGVLTGEDRTLQRLINTGWSIAERRDATRYRPGQVLEFHRSTPGTRDRDGRQSKFDRASRWSVVRSREGDLLLEQAGERSWLSLSRAYEFSVYDVGSFRCAVGETVRITKNQRVDDVRLINNDRHRVVAVSEDGITLENGVRFKATEPMHLAHGYVVTSHASQGHTVDRVLLVAPSQSIDVITAATFYVGVSRARERIQVFTDLKEELQATIEDNLGVRPAAVEALGEVKPTAEEELRWALQRERRETRERERKARQGQEAGERAAERERDRAILRELFSRNLLGPGRPLEVTARYAAELLSRIVEPELSRIKPTLERVIARARELMIRSSRFPEAYEAQLRRRFSRLYPSPTEEQRSRIEARVAELLTAATGSQATVNRADRIEDVLVGTYREKLHQDVFSKYGRENAPFLEERIETEVARYRKELFDLSRERRAKKQTK